MIPVKAKSIQPEIDVDRVWLALANVSDPEIPVLSILEMGMIPAVRVEDGTVIVDLTPTFAGCPALDVIRGNIMHAIVAAGFDKARVNVVFDPPWSSDQITPEGRRKLKAFGLAPPSKCGTTGATFKALQSVTCPYCNSADTTLESIFGPTLCRAIHYCNSCLQSFEQFKPVG